jgi:hypothetical protein
MHSIDQGTLNLSSARDLNSTSDHFLLELIQNSDDAQYEHNYPTLTLTYTYNHHLKTFCDEFGFTAKDATAISDLYRSTKVDSQTSTGEKGIGFKSVLGVANIAWIASRGYHFKLYADREKAMKPEWFELPFPDNSYANATGTSMYFELATTKAAHVAEAVRLFDPSNLLFLKRLKQINLVIEERTEKFARTEEPLSDGTSNVTILQTGRPMLHYKQFSFPFVSQVQRKENKQNKTSQIKFGFPASDDFQDIIHREEKVYACLPIKSFGFKVRFRHAKLNDTNSL